MVKKVTVLILIIIVTFTGFNNLASASNLLPDPRINYWYSNENEIRKWRTSTPSIWVGALDSNFSFTQLNGK